METTDKNNPQEVGCDQKDGYAILVDVETTFNETNGPSPYDPDNYLVSIGWRLKDLRTGAWGDDKYLFVKHNELTEPQHDRLAEFDHDLENAVLFIAHNAKFDLAWMIETGRPIDIERTKIYCTQIGEYILARGQFGLFDLDSVAKERRLTHKKGDLVKQYIKDGIGFEAMPMEIVEEYGRGDVITESELYDAQQKDYAISDYLLPTVRLMNDFLVVLRDMEANGIAVDREELERLDKEFEKEQADLKQKLQRMVEDLMGDTPINLNSSDQISQVVYSRAVKNKRAWAETFNIGTNANGKAKRRPFMKPAEFVRAVRANTTVLKKTHAKQCGECKGTGYIQKYRKDGQPYKNKNRCPSCNTSGFTYEDTGVTAGLKISPKGVKDVSADGFATNKTVLEQLIGESRAKNDLRAVEFLTAYMRLNAINTYRSTYVDGIRKYTNESGILHTNFNQTIARTGRLSSSGPNFQNMPRAKTFPVRRVVISRWKGGSILSADFSQLEFRCAGELARCETVLQAVLDNFDVHSFTSKVMTDAGQPTDRQEAKPHTFKPLYGGMSGTEAEQTYYKTFLESYPGVLAWHKELERLALNTKRIRLPTGREYEFPNTKRTRSGYVVGSTQFKNYPVQGFATADIVPLVNIKLWWRLREAKVKSVLFLTVHDDIEIDVYPGEEKQIVKIVHEVFSSVHEYVKDWWGYEMMIPIDGEIKIGPNWLEGKEIENPVEYAAAA